MKEKYFVIVLISLCVLNINCSKNVEITLYDKDDKILETIDTITRSISKNEKVYILPNHSICYYMFDLKLFKKR